MRNLKFSKKHNRGRNGPTGKPAQVAKPVKAAPVKAAPAKAVPAKTVAAAPAKPQKK